ncbi:MAG: Asp-tRNA(Asn)/Glu-tRNA(Gln) amidotransferase subunit GatC [Candidatus Omnitrophica bacterium]|nr:Asp-tRNA(Asn)/Glu-tRNA(Gln) amidotransferase subunit GatC [Candidatus Omnitrophota bacterium]
MPDTNPIDKKTVEHVARLARINLSAQEIGLYKKQLADILEYINKLNKVDVKNTLPTSHPMGKIKNVFRKDSAKKSLPVEDVLRNAPNKKDSLFVVPKIIG